MYKVILSACGNIDHGENPVDNFVNGIRVYETVQKAETIEECQQLVRIYIGKYDLGGGNWTGGCVFKGDEQVGYISYNGRYWEKGHKYYRNCEQLEGIGK